MPIVELRDPGRIEQHLRQHAGLHVYDVRQPRPLLLARYPLVRDRDRRRDCSRTLLALCAEADLPAMRALMREASPAWPSRLYAHLSPGLAASLPNGWMSEPRGQHVKMQLIDVAVLEPVETSGIVKLGPEDRRALEHFYQAHYPNNWFDPRMLGTGCYVGLPRTGGGFCAVAGVHVFSKEMRVAALGNIAVARELRGQGLGRMITPALCKLLAGEVDVTGLNVDAANEPAIRCYAGLGFRKIATYEEHVLRRETRRRDG